MTAPARSDEYAEASSPLHGALTEDEFVSVGAGIKTQKLRLVSVWSRAIYLKLT